MIFDHSDAVGSGWPDPLEPGVPASALDSGIHFMRWPRTHMVTVGEWSPDLWCWVVCYLGGITDPLSMAHLDYCGPAFIGRTISGVSA